MLLHEFSMAPEIGFEPTTLRLTAACSTAELLRNINGYFAILSNWKFNVNNFTQFFYKFLDLIENNLCYAKFFARIKKFRRKL